MKWLKDKMKKKAKEPREMDEIKKEYSQLLSKVGQAQYVVYVHSQDLEQYNQRLLEVNKEAQARENLNKEEVANTAQGDKV